MEEKKIHIYYINKIKRLDLKIFEYEDDDYPNRRGVNIRKMCKNFIGTDNVLRSIDYRPTKEVAQEILQKVCDSLVAEFVKSADIQELSTVRGILRNVCPAKVHKIIIRIAKEYGVEVEYEKQ